MIRSWMFVPGDSERKLEKSLGNPADALILDLEDAVSNERQDIAREMVRELIFVGPCLVLALGGWLLGGSFQAEAPIWVRALGGSVLGYLAGGGVVWGVRIFGSLLFGKEAMGLGDVHLMAGVGAILGWADPTIAG